MADHPKTRRRRRLRSRLNLLILKTLAVDVAVPVTLAELTRLLWAGGSQTPMQANYRLKHPSFLTICLWRLADRGLVKVEGYRDRKYYQLTPEGMEILESLETGEAGEEEKGFLAAVGRIAKAALARIRRSSADGRRLVRMTGDDLRDVQGLSPRLCARGFLSYDLPYYEQTLRRSIVRALRRAGFERLHQSTYVGPKERLLEAIESLEPLKVLPRLRWGVLIQFCR